MSWECEVEHVGLNRYRVVRGRTEFEAQQKGNALAQQWEEMYQRKLAAEEKREEKARIAEDKEAKKVELEWFYDISSWEEYKSFLGSGNFIKKPYEELTKPRIHAKLLI